MNKSMFIFISGTAGVGKNTVIDALIENNKGEYLFLNSHTSREKREDDSKAGRYNYVSKDEFEQLIAENKILEYDMFGENYYGISKEEINNLSKLNKIVLKDLSVKGVINCKDIFKDKLKISGIFLTNTKKVLKERLINRKYSKAQIKSRLKLYKSEQAKIPFYDFVIFNDDLQNTLNQCEAIINLEKSNSNLKLGSSTQLINEKQIDKIASRILKNKKINKITAFENNGALYILDGANEYLACLKTKMSQPIFMVNTPSSFKPNEEQQLEWEKLIKLYS